MGLVPYSQGLRRTRHNVLEYGASVRWLFLVLSIYYTHIIATGDLLVNHPQNREVSAHLPGVKNRDFAPGPD